MKKKVLAVLIIMASAIIGLTGCGSFEKTPANKVPQALSIVIGARANNMGINLNNIVVQDTVSNAVKSNGYISVVCVDGEPDLIAANLYEIPNMYKNANTTKLEADALMKANNLLVELASIKANDPESDVLESLRLAVRSLADISGMEKTILVMDSGLSTTGVMDFNRNLILADPGDLADTLYQKAAIPNFEGVTVIWLQMGDVAAPQEELTSAQRESLTAIWRAIIEKTGGTVIFSEAPANPAVDASYPDVTPVELPNEMPISYDAAVVEEAAAKETESELFNEPQFLSEEQVKFIGDSDQYINEASAIEVITPIADYMVAHPDFELLLIGTTAGDETTDYSIRLSKARADTVKSTLISLGVPEERLLTLGLGSSDSWHIYGVGTGMNDPMAASNRKVVLIDANTDTAKGLLNPQ